MGVRQILLITVFFLLELNKLNSQVNLNQGLVAYYPFDGNANDASGNNNNPIFNNAKLTADRFGNANRAYYFNGKNTYMRIPNAPSLNPKRQISTVAWVKPMGYNHGPCHENSMFIKGDQDFLPGNYLLRFGDAQYVKFTNCSNDVDTAHENFSTDFGGVSGSFEPYITSNKWYLVIATYDGDTAKLFVNCQLVAKFAQKGLSFVNNYDLFIGTMNDPSFPYWLNGALDDIRIYNRALTLDEVNALGSCLQQGTNTVIPSFNAPDTVCVNSPVNITNTSTGATTYYWSFCTPDIKQAPEAVNLGDPGNLNGPVFSDYAVENGKYYGFIVNNYSGTLTRLDFGKSILNKPTSVDLGDVGGTLKQQDEGIQVLKENGKWYAFVVGGDPDFGGSPHLVKIEFGNSITNTPTATDWGDVGQLYQPVDLYMFKDGVEWHGFTVNAKTNTVTRFDFDNGIDIPPNTTNLGNVGGYLNYPTGICAVNDDGFWRIFITNAIGESITRLDFGPSLLNNSPIATDLGNPDNTLFLARDFTVIKSCAGIIGFAVNAPGNSNLVQFDFHGDLTSVPSGKSLGTNGGLNFPHSLSKFFRVGPDLYSFITNVSNNTVTRLRFPGCTNSDIPNSNAKDPPPVSYSSPGLYNITLFVDDSLATQSSFCKQVVVVNGPSLKVSGDTLICNGDTAHLRVSGGSGYTWLGSGLLSTSGSAVVALPTATSKYYVTGHNTTGCAATDSIVVKVTTCTANCNGSADFSFAQKICNPKQLDFNNGTKNVASLSWAFGDGQKAENTATPSVTYNNYGNYNVRLIVVTNDGCIDSTTKNILVNINRDSLVTSNDTLLCNGAQLQLNALPALSYCWSPSTGLSATNIANPVATVKTKTTYYLNALVIGDNLIVNGDFSQGNIGFKSSYKYSTSGLPEGVYFVGPNPKLWHPNMPPCQDHTGGSTPNMMLVNGAVTTNVEVWSETVNIKRNTNYAFSTWLETISFLNPAKLQFFINGHPVGDVFTASSSSCVWDNFFATWNSGQSDTARISVINMNSTAEGNDFALDDISFAETGVKFDSVTVTSDSVNVTLSNDTAICSGKAVRLNASIPPGSTFGWQPSQELDDASSLHPLASPASSTKFYINVVSQKGCKAQDSLVVNVTPQPTVIVINDTAICSGTTVTLLTTSTNSTAYKWSPTNDLSDPYAQSPVATPSSSTQYVVTVNQGTLCTAKDTVNIAVKPTPVIQPSNDTTLCFGGSAQLFALSQGNVSYQWLPATGLDDSTIYNPLASPTTSTTYTIKAIADDNCETDATIRITVNPKPVFSIDPASKQLCNGDVLTITASGGDAYQWYSQGIPTNQTSASIQVTPQSPTVYMVVVTNTACKVADTLSSTVGVLTKPVVTIAKSNDLDCVQSSATLTAAGGSKYVWTPATGLNNPNIANPVASPLQTTTYYVLVDNGCTTRDSITVNVLVTNAANGYKMPSAFTPNGDGVNDCFGLKYWGGVQTLEFEVYNRWGNRIFYTADAGRCWDGTFKGLPQPPGTYVYQIKATTICGNIYRKGTVVLIR